MSPNAYYNYLKNRKNEYRKRKCDTQRRIVYLYHRENGVPGYRQIQFYLNQEGWYVSPLLILWYMCSLNLKSIVRRRKSAYVKGNAHKVFANFLNCNFTAEKSN